MMRAVPGVGVKRPATRPSSLMPASAGMTKEVNGVSPSNPVTPDLIRVWIHIGSATGGMFRLEF